jgi:hypothetical protein
MQPEGRGVPGRNGASLARLGVDAPQPTAMSRFTFCSRRLDNSRHHQSGEHENSGRLRNSLLLTLLCMIGSGSLRAQTDPPASWNGGTAKKSITDSKLPDRRPGEVGPQVLGKSPK